MAQKMSIGDVVRLRSGGPWLTVTKDRPEAGSKFVEASWFDGSSLEKDLFPKDALEVDPARVKAEAKDAKDATKAD